LLAAGPDADLPAAQRFLRGWDSKNRCALNFF
jgi:hypothetical protein